MQETVPGWSTEIHQRFWSTLFKNKNWRSLLMIGVYMGRDLSNIAKLCSKEKRNFWLVGVDKFEDSFCKDWPPEKLSLSWEQAGYGTPPSMELAKDNILKHCEKNIKLDLFKERDTDFLSRKYCFDIIYLDASHDYQSVKNQCNLLRNVCHRDSIICGDDYSDEGSWGVKKAVNESFVDHKVFENWIWLADAKQLI